MQMYIILLKLKNLIFVGNSMTTFWKTSGRNGITTTGTLILKFSTLCAIMI